MPVKKSLNQLQITPFVRELRVLTDLTQEQFAAKLGVTYSSVSRWERGRGIPSPLAMQKIEGMRSADGRSRQGTTGAVFGAVGAIALQVG